MIKENIKIPWEANKGREKEREREREREKKKKRERKKKGGKNCKRKKRLVIKGKKRGKYSKK